MGKNKDYREISRNNMKIIGVFFGNNGMVMRYAQRITKSSLGLLFSRSGVQQKIMGIAKVIMRKEKEPYVARKMCATQGSIFSFFLGISEDAELCLF